MKDVFDAHEALDLKDALNQKYDDGIKSKGR